jgi:hypothetical protein
LGVGKGQGAGRCRHRIIGSRRTVGPRAPPAGVGARAAVFAALGALRAVVSVQAGQVALGHRRGVTRRRIGAARPGVAAVVAARLGATTFSVVTVASSARTAVVATATLT